MTRIILNQDADLVKEIREKIKQNAGHCCCAIEFTPDNVCMCKEFRDQVAQSIPGCCGCGLYEVQVDD